MFAVLRGQGQSIEDMHTLTVLIMCITAVSFLKLKVRGVNSKQSFSKEEFYQTAAETGARLDPASSAAMVKYSARLISIKQGGC